MSKIIILMGKSSTGKDTIYREILNRTNLGKIVPYTTRPIRTGEKHGVDYFFVTDDFIEENRDKIIEIRTYDTIHGKWSYFEMNDLQLESNKDLIFITTLEGYKGFLEYFGSEKLVPIYITVDDGLRLQRALDREIKQENPKYAEMCRRYLSDSDDFSEEKLSVFENIKRFENNNLEDVIQEIIEYLKYNNVKL